MCACVYVCACGSLVQGSLLGGRWWGESPSLSLSSLPLSFTLGLIGC